MSSLKTVQEEIEKALAATLRTRFTNAFINGELKSTDFDDKDLKRLQTNDADGELYLRLFIRSRQGDLEKAYTTMIASLKWRKQYKIRDVTDAWLEEDNVRQVIQGEGVLFYHNTDKKKNPVLIFQGNKYKYKKDDSKEEILEKLFAFLLEKQHQKRLGKQILVICDHQNATLDHIDLKFFKFVVYLFNTYYPNILAAWRNIQKWLNPDTSPKFKFVDKAQLTDYVEKSKLLTSLGGQDTYEYNYPPSPDQNTQHPFDPSVNEEGISDDPDTQSPFEDAIEQVDEKIELNSLEETPARDNGSFPTQNMGAGMGTQIRNRFNRNRYDDHHSSIGETSIDQDLPDELSLIISPSDEITFKETEGANEVEETLKLTNRGENRVIFKIKTNSAAHFRVKPSIGALEPGSSKDVILMVLLKAEESQEKHQWNKDKFLILFAEHQDEITAETNIAELWKNTPKSCTKEYKLNCRVLDANGLEKRPKTIDDAVQMNLKLQQQLLELQEEMGSIMDPLKEIQHQLSQQRKFLIIISVVFVISLLLILYWFR